MADYKSRAAHELAELHNRIRNLIEFNNQPYEYKELSPDAQEDLQEQLQHMQAYKRVLARRVNKMMQE